MRKKRCDWAHNSFTHSFTHFFTHSFTHSFTHPFTHPFTHSHTHNRCFKSSSRNWALQVCFSRCQSTVATMKHGRACSSGVFCWIPLQTFPFPPVHLCVRFIPRPLSPWAHDLAALACLPPSIFFFHVDRYFENDTYHFPIVYWADAPPAFMVEGTNAQQDAAATAENASQAA